MNKPTWGVVGTVSEPAPLLAAFAAHYVAAGASLVHLFFDSPNPEAAALLARFPEVKITLADDAHYRKLGRKTRPGHIHRRQRLNATTAYKLAEVDWLLHVDADEFVETALLADELAAQPDKVDSLSLPNSERFFELGKSADSIFAGKARLPINGPDAKLVRLLGKEAQQYTTHGLSGHDYGKSISRTGRALKLGIHAPVREGKPVVARAKSTVCHFDGLTPFHFVLKLMRYAKTTIYDRANPTGINRSMQLQFARECDFDLRKLHVLHGYVSGLSQVRAEKLAEKKYARDIKTSPLQATRKYYTKDEVDLSISAFDRALAARSEEAAEIHARWVDLGLDGKIAS